MEKRAVLAVFVLSSMLAAKLSSFQFILLITTDLQAPSKVSILCNGHLTWTIACRDLRNLQNGMAIGF